MPRRGRSVMHRGWPSREPISFWVEGWPRCARMRGYWVSVDVQLEQLSVTATSKASRARFHNP